MISHEFLGSRLPVGSSANRIVGLLIKALALLEQINENGTTVLVVTHNREIVNSMQKLYFPASPTVERMLGTFLLISLFDTCIILCANATFSYTFLSFKSRKSWNTIPRFLLNFGNGVRPGKD